MRTFVILHAIEQTQLRRQHRDDGVGRLKLDFHTGRHDDGAGRNVTISQECGRAARPFFKDLLNVVSPGRRAVQVNYQRQRARGVDWCPDQELLARLEAVVPEAIEGGDLLQLCGVEGGEGCHLCCCFVGMTAALRRRLTSVASFDDLRRGARPAVVFELGAAPSFAPMVRALADVSAQKEAQAGRKEQRRPLHNAKDESGRDFQQG